MRKFVFIVTILLPVFTAHNVYCQFWENDPLIDGIIYTKNDTIKCFLPLSESYNGKIKYKFNKNDRKFLKIENREVLALRRGAFRFERINYDGHNFLAKVVVNGRVKLMEGVSKSGGAPMMMPNGTSTSGGNYEATDYYVSKDSLIIKLTRKNFRDELKRIMIYNENIVKLIDDLKYKDLEFKLHKIIAQYNRTNSY